MRLNERESRLYCEWCQAESVFSTETMHARCAQKHCMECGRLPHETCVECRKYVDRHHQEAKWDTRPDHHRGTKVLS